MKKSFAVLSIAALALLAAGCNSSSTTSTVPATPSPAPQAVTAMGPSQKQVDLTMAMRKLWTDHVVWTREYIVAAVNGTPDAQAAATRLLQNQVDIGNAIVPYYGQAAGDQLAALLKQHILIAVDIINDLKKNDHTKFAADNSKWSDNGKQIADFLAGANPAWPQQALEDMMTKHLSTTALELTDYLAKKYDADVQDFDAVYMHILDMSDALSAGIVKQFPEKF